MNKFREVWRAFWAEKEFSKAREGLESHFPSKMGFSKSDEAQRKEKNEGLRKP